MLIMSANQHNVEDRQDKPIHCQLSNHPWHCICYFLRKQASWSNLEIIRIRYLSSYYIEKEGSKPEPSYNDPSVDSFVFREVKPGVMDSNNILHDI